MEITPILGTVDPHFVVKMATDIYDDITGSRTLQVAALIGVCGRFPSVFKEGGPHADLPIADEKSLQSSTWRTEVVGRYTSRVDPRAPSQLVFRDRQLAPGGRLRLSGGVGTNGSGPVF